MLGTFTRHHRGTLSPAVSSFHEIGVVHTTQAYSNQISVPSIFKFPHEPFRIATLSKLRLIGQYFLKDLACFAIVTLLR